MKTIKKITADNAREKAENYIKNNLAVSYVWKMIKNKSKNGHKELITTVHTTYVDKLKEELLSNGYMVEIESLKSSNNRFTIKW